MGHQWVGITRSRDRNFERHFCPNCGTIKDTTPDEPMTPEMVVYSRISGKMLTCEEIEAEKIHSS